MDIARARKAIVLDDERRELMATLNDIDESDQLFIGSVSCQMDSILLPDELRNTIKQYYENQLSELTKQIDDL